MELFAQSKPLKRCCLNWKSSFVYHRQYWCRKHYQHFKKIKACFNGMVLFLTLCGVIAGNNLALSWLVTLLTTLGVLVKG